MQFLDSKDPKCVSNLWFLNRSIRTAPLIHLNLRHRSNIKTQLFYLFIWKLCNIPRNFKKFIPKVNMISTISADVRMISNIRMHLNAYLRSPQKNGWCNENWALYQYFHYNSSIDAIQQSKSAWKIHRNGLHVEPSRRHAMKFTFPHTSKAINLRSSDE